MLIKFIQFAMALLVSLPLMAESGMAAPAFATDSVVKGLWIEGHAYEAELTVSQLTGIEPSDDSVHYKGHFPEDPDSWVRVSRLGERWEGLAFMFGRLHTLNGGGSVGQFVSYSFSREQAPRCGLDHDHDHDHGDFIITPESLTSPAMAQAVSASFDTLCDEKVNGVCLMLELELAFDQQFQQSFDNFEGRAGSIMNMVEGFYERQFGIVFDTLSLTFLSEENSFSNSAVANTLLEDIAGKRGNNQISFLESDRSLFHLITGRQFVEGVAGLAYLGTVCPLTPSDGLAIGVSSAARSMASTAIVVAHELGHNLGARHDSVAGPNGNACPAGENIMSPNVRSTFSEFSSCSEDYITTTVSSLNNIEQCFNFPADAGITAVAGNPAEVDQGESFAAFFDIDYEDATESADGFVVAGSVGDGEGTLVDVSLNGTPCAVTGNTVFNCAETNAQSGLRLTVQATAGAGASLNLLNNVTLISDSGDVKDIKPDNNALMTTIILDDTGSGGTAPTDPVGSPGGGTGSAPSSSSSGSSGGGGSVGWFWLLAGLAGFGRMTRSSA